MDKKIKLMTNSSLQKIFKDRGPTQPETGGVMLRNETYNFQTAFFADTSMQSIMLSAESSAFDLSVRYVRELRADKEDCEESDDYYDKSADRMYPEILTPQVPKVLAGGRWHSFWIQLKTKDGVSAGTYAIPIKLCSGKKVLTETEYKLEVLDGNLPELDIPVTCWMHYDCISHRHNVTLFETDFYKIFEKYLNLYVGRGHNMLLIPTITPALDTAVGAERMTAQLVDIVEKGGNYFFDFNRLDKFINFVSGRGIRYFEFAHLFTQWGAKSCPKILARTENGIEKIFGWETDSTGSEYKHFLSQYLPALIGYVTKKGIAERSYFHLSDEPNAEHIDRYEELYRFIKQFKNGIKTMDALSHFDFYTRGIVDIPVVASDAAEPFLEHNAKHFVYYCGAQNKGYVSGRFFAMPSERNAVIGVQIYQNDSSGFLHWGFNFYNTQYSTRHINPYTDTASGGNFPSGDAFVVYPDGDKVIASLRLEVFYEGIQLYLALRKLESIIGREEVIGILKARGFRGYGIYPQTPVALKELKKELYMIINLKGRFSG